MVGLKLMRWNRLLCVLSLSISERAVECVVRAFIWLFNMVGIRAGGLVVLGFPVLF